VNIKRETFVAGKVYALVERDVTVRGVASMVGEYLDVFDDEKPEPIEGSTMRIFRINVSVEDVTDSEESW